MPKPGNIVLVGSMGSGKSRVGRLLAERLGWQFVDTDDLVEQRAGRTISRIFADDGESAFRLLETDALHDLFGATESVIATGGGIVLCGENWPLLRRLGPVVYLRAEPATLWARLAAERAHRPLLAASPDPQTTLRELLDRRDPLYAQADFRIPTDGQTPEAIVEGVLKATGMRVPGESGPPA